MINMGWIREGPVLQFSPDGLFIVAARNVFRSGGVFALEVWESATGAHVATFPAERESLEHAGVISGIAFSPDGKFLASASWDHSIRLWDLKERRCIQTILGNLSEVWALTFAPDGRHIISGAKDGTVRLWPIKTVANDNILSGNWTPIGFSRDGRLLAALKGDDLLVFVNVKTREIEEQFELPSTRSRFPNPFLTRELSQDMKILAEPSGPGAIRILDPHTRESTELQSPHRRIDSIALSPDGVSVLTGSRGGPVFWWDLRRKSDLPKKIEGERALFSEDGKTLIILTQVGFSVWDWRTGAERTNFVADPPLRHASALSPDGAILAAASDPQDVENAIRLWNTRTGRLIGLCAGHTQGIRSLAFSSDGKTLASASTDSTLRLWNVATQQQLIAVQQLGALFHDLIFSPDGTYLVAKSFIGDTPALRFFEAPTWKR